MMANNKKNKFYTVKDCTPFSQDVNDDVLKKLSEYFEKTAEGSNDDDDKIVSLQTMLYHYEEGEPTVHGRSARRHPFHHHGGGADACMAPCP